MQIRQEQMAVLEEAALKSFEDWMVEHLTEHFPGPCEALGEVPVRKAIRHGNERAEEYGFSTRHEVCLYVDLMFMLGSGFDTDFQLPWAGTILRDDAITDPNERIETLYDRAMEYLDLVAPEETTHSPAFYSAARKLTCRGMKLRLEGHPLSGLNRIIAVLWPEKRGLMESADVHNLFSEARRAAEPYGITDGVDIGIFAVLMFSLGHRFDRDPIYPWAAEALAEENAESPTQKMHNTFMAAKDYLEAVLD
jgi:hypothetical protein